MHYCADLGRTGTLELLLAWGASASLGDKYGYTPFHIACFRGRMDVVNIMLLLLLPTKTGFNIEAVDNVSKR